MNRLSTSGFTCERTDPNRTSDAEPPDVPSICVKIVNYGSWFVDEETRTYDNADEIAPPPGRGWLRGVRKGGSTHWYRRRSLS